MAAMLWETGEIMVYPVPAVMGDRGRIGKERATLLQLPGQEPSARTLHGIYIRTAGAVFLWDAERNRRICHKPDDGKTGPGLPITAE